MITLVLTNRNREIRIVKNCLDSLQNQSDKDFEWYLVDYGSQEDYLIKLKALVANYSKVNLITCQTSGQLWSKCRSINIVVKKATQPFFVVGDIDLIFHPTYISTLKKVANEKQVHYFQYGFLSEQESLKNKKFDDYIVDFKGYEEVTGNTMFPTVALRNVNGFDEFYQGWGAEDTDAHIRMQNLGLEIVFYNKEILVKHQWHPKTYRSKESTNPYHSYLERINHEYMINTQSAKRTKVNQNLEWGKPTNEDDYKKLLNPTFTFNLDNSVLKTDAILAQFNNFQQEVVKFVITKVNIQEKFKNKIKKIVGKKFQPYYEMEDLNNLLLEEIIKNYRNCPYNYSFNRQTNTIILVINFTQ